MEKVIITGATSMVGIALLNQLISSNVKVFAIIRKNSNHKKRLPDSELVTIAECDLSELNQFIPNCDGDFDVFYHLGWSNTQRKYLNDPYKQNENISFTLDAIELAHRMGCKAFIGIGSQAEYGKMFSKANPYQNVRPETAYGIAKYSAGRLGLLLCQQYEMNFIWGRIFSLYGPYDREDSMLMYAIKKLVNNEKPSFTSCEQFWDYLYIQDAGLALYMIGLYGKNQAVYNIASGNSLPLREYIQDLSRTIGNSCPLGFGEIDNPVAQNLSLFADISNLTQDTGFRPQTQFTDGIKKTIDWYIANK